MLGSLDVDGIADLAPCWRALLIALARHIPVRWLAGTRPVPAWLDGSAIVVVRAAPAEPGVRVVSAATPVHEVLEAVRWMRQLLASGQARAEDIAIAANDPSAFDAHMLALRAQSGIGLHFVHGVPVAATRDGQAAGALADILVRGLSHARLRRLVHLCDAGAPLLRALPDGWLRALPSDAALTSPQSWARLLARLTSGSWPDEVDHTPELAALVALLQAGPGRRMVPAKRCCAAGRCRSGVAHWSQHWRLVPRSGSASWTGVRHRQ